MLELIHKLHNREILILHRILLLIFISYTGNLINSQSVSDTLKQRYTYINKNKLNVRFAPYGGLAYVKDSSNKRRMLEKFIGIDARLEYFVLKRFSLNLGLSYYFDKYYFTNDIAGIGSNFYISYYPKIGITDRKFKWLTNAYNVSLGIGQETAFKTPKYKELGFKSASIFLGHSFTYHPNRIFSKKPNNHWGFSLSIKILTQQIDKHWIPYLGFSAYGIKYQFN